MILKQYYLGCLSHASYLIGDEGTKTAFVVDPQRDVDQYINDAKQLGLTIQHVILTHLHADFVSGHLELRNRVGATIHIGAHAKTEYAVDPIHDGDVIETGSVRLQFLETPGHTPESVSVVVYDLQTKARTGAVKPHAVLTGDTLFIGDVGRPDLMAAIGWTSAQLAGMMYDSLYNKLLALPDETLVYPAHGAGSLCGKNLSKETVSTIGAQRKTNYALQPMTKEQFIAMLTAEQPDAPEYFGYDATLNSKERQTLEEMMTQTLHPLSAETIFALQTSGAQLLDARNPVNFSAGHIIGSINVGLNGQYATWAGTVLDPKKQIIIIAEPGEETSAAMRLGRIGFDRIAGYLEGGMTAQGIPKSMITQTALINANELAAEINGKKAAMILDVRGPGEWNTKHIGGSVNIPLNHLRERLREIPKDENFVLHCQSGYRSSIAASILQEAGIRNFKELTGGFAAWETQKHDTVSTG